MGEGVAVGEGVATGKEGAEGESVAVGDGIANPYKKNQPKVGNFLLDLVGLGYVGSVGRAVLVKESLEVRAVCQPCGRRRSGPGRAHARRRGTPA